MTGSRSLVGLVAVLALLLAACGTTPASQPSPSASAISSESAEPSSSTAPSDPAAEPVTVRLESFAFDTEELTVSAGTTVRFVNADGAAHTVTEGSDGTATAGPIINEELEQNGTARFTFDEPGTYEITCLFHPSMNMTVIVE